MKPVRIQPENPFMDQILETLKLVPKTRLRIVRDVVEALAKPTAKGKRKAVQKRKEKKSLLDTPFCGMWADRTDIADGQSFARTLRRQLETRGDRAANLR